MHNQNDLFGLLYSCRSPGLTTFVTPAELPSDAKMQNSTENALQHTHVPSIRNATQLQHANESRSAAPQAALAPKRKNICRFKQVNQFIWTAHRCQHPLLVDWERMHTLKLLPSSFEPYRVISTTSHTVTIIQDEILNTICLDRAGLAP